MINKLCDYASYRSERVASSSLNKHTYVGVDNMVKNCGGVIDSEYVPSEGFSQKFYVNDILIGNIRPYFKKIWLADHDGGCSADVLVLKPNKGTNAKLLFSVLCSDDFFNYDMAGAKGSKMPRGDKKHIMNYPIAIDATAENKIGEVIVNINKKISNNIELINKNHEAIDAIYDQWFINFDFPTHDGHCYRQAHREFIPNELLNTEIPVGWTSDYLVKRCDVCLGGTPSTEKNEFWNGDIPWLNSGEVACFPVVTSELQITKLGLDSSATKLMKAGTVLISITGNIRCSFLGFDACANQSVVGILENDLIKKEYLYPLISRLLNKYTSISGGNCQKHINKGEVENTPILIPSKEILDKYYDAVSPMFDQIVTCAKENIELENLRNELIPTIISGQAKIGD